MAEGYINVRVGKLPGKIESYALNGDRTVQAALNAASMLAQGYEVRVNNIPVTDFASAVRENDTILLVKQIKGNGNH